MNELDSKARALLRATQFADEPSQDDYDWVHAAVTARIAVGVAVGAAVTTAAKTASAGAAAHAAATATTAAVASTTTVGATSAVVTGTAAAGALVGTSVAAPAMVAAGAGAAVGTSVVSALPVVKIVAWVVAASMTAGIGTGAVVVARNHSAARASVVVAPVVVAPAVDPPRSIAVKPRSEGQPLAARGPVSDPLSSHADAPLVAQPATSQPSAQASSQTETDKHAPMPAMSASMLEAEVALIRDARAALSRDDAAHAIALLDDHARRFPSGAMSQDRDALQVFATCASGQPEAARELATRFLSLHAGSPYAASVRASCVAQK